MNRTISSAKSLLAGLYLENFLVDSNEPFVINLNDGETDYLYPNSRNCRHLQEFYLLKKNHFEYMVNREYIDLIESFGDETARIIRQSPFGKFPL